MRKRSALSRTVGTTLGVALLAAGLTAGPGTPATADTSSSVASSRAKVTTVNGCVGSVPEPGSRAKVKICYSIFRPGGATSKHPVPMIMHSHGWGGSRTTDASKFRAFTQAGYAVISFDQRGWGQSGGHAHVENPAIEGRDVRRLVRLVSTLSWVTQDGTGDPRLGSIGGSYGGGYQFLGAFEELRLHGKPIFDALAPEITWNDLRGSIAPEGVVRTEWALALSAASLLSNALPLNVYKGLIEGAVTGTLPDGSLPGGENLVKFFKKNGPAWHVAHGRRLDIPVLLGQGTTDTLFPLEQGLKNWATAITPRARRHSIFVGYNGGHTLPALLPSGIEVDSDPCSRQLAGSDFQHLSVRFFNEQLKHEQGHLHGYGKIHLATPKSTCTTIASPKATTAQRVGRVTSATAAGLPLSYKVAKGPIRVAGTPYLTGKVTALGVDNRAFYGLAIGTSPATAHLVQNNVLPLREPRPVVDARRRVALPSLAVNVPRGQTLYLLASPFSDTFVAMGSRVPGLITIQDTVAHLPVVRP